MDTRYPSSTLSCYPNARRAVNQVTPKKPADDRYFETTNQTRIHRAWGSGDSWYRDVMSANCRC